MMRKRFFLSLSLLAVLLAACAPATNTVVPAQQVSSEPSATFVPPVQTLDNPAQATAAPTEALAPTPFPIATSRGPNLEASDPTTINLAADGVQFIEFFRFT
jgi:hypothetical protein